MIRMRMINPDDAPGAVLELALGGKPASRIHVVTIVRTICVQVSTLSKRMHNTMVSRSLCPDQEAATLMRIGRLHMIVDLAEH
jgi:hypothetical protein